jgi:hypothetical protein
MTVVKIVPMPGPQGIGIPDGGTDGQIMIKSGAEVVWSDNIAPNTEQYVKNMTGSPIAAGTPVYISGASGDNVLISVASNTTESGSSKTMGLAKTSIANGGFGWVITEGTITNINTNGSVAGDPVWLGVNGAKLYGLANKPVAPNHLVYLGAVIRSNANNGSILVQVQNGFELQELHNVKITDVQNNDILKYNSTLGLWVNVPGGN